jgi:3-dehydroquinate synthase
MEHQAIYFTNEVDRQIAELIESFGSPRTFVLVDDNTEKCVLPLLESLRGAKVISVPSGDVNKNLDSLVHIWNELQSGGANRKSLMINLGGGMVTDMGGFAASTFKRGMRFINVPTTLLSAVDAAVGGKTGINFNGLKNELGVFREAEAVVISTGFFATLPIEEVRSGYAEMLKHGLIDTFDNYNRLLSYNVAEADAERLLSLLEESVNVKRRVVAIDPFEHGLRRALNLGHTIGHAFESYAMRRNAPVPHGYAVAWGCVVELILSHMSVGFPSEQLQRFADYVYENYGAYPLTCNDYPELLELMHHDKKNTSSEINFTLLKNVGEVLIDCTCSEEDIKTAMDIFRDYMHI